MSLLDNLVAFWPLSEVAGQPRVDVVNGYDMLEGEGGNVQQDTGVCTGTCARFHEASNECLKLDGDSVNDLSPTGTFQIAGWFKHEHVAPDGSALISKRRDWVSTADYGVYFDAAAGIVLYLRNAGDTATVTVNSSLALTFGAWYFWTVWYDFTTAEAGIKVSPSGGVSFTTDTGTLSGGIRSGSTAKLRMGRQDDTGQLFLNGYMQNIGFWNGRVLTDAEVNFLAGAFNGGCPPDYPWLPTYTRVWSYLG